MPRFHPGAHFGLLTIVRLINTGDFSEVYEVLDATGAHCALKLLAERAAPLNAEQSLRLGQEAHALVELNHAHIIRLYDTGITESSLWLLTELVEGPTLRQLMRQEGGVLPVERAVRLVRQVCEGMDAAHARGIVHRDLSPDNILVAPNDHAKVVDFASAKLRGWIIATTPSQAVGSARYSAPEYIGLRRQRIITPKSDVYALGLTLSEALRGTNPVVPEDADLATACRLQTTFEPPPLSTVMSGIPWRLSDALVRALSKDPGYRWTMREFADELDLVLGDLQVDLRRAVRSLPFAHLRTAVAMTEQAMPVYAPESEPTSNSGPGSAPSSSGPRLVSDRRLDPPAASGVVSRGAASGPGSGRDAVLPDPPSIPETLRTPSQPAAPSGPKGTQIMSASIAPSMPQPPSTPVVGARTEPMSVMPSPHVGAPTPGAHSAAWPRPHPLAATLAATLPLGQSLPLGQTLAAASAERRSSGAPIETTVPRPTKPSRVATVAAVAAGLIALALTAAWLVLGGRVGGLGAGGSPAPASAPSGATEWHPHGTAPSASASSTAPSASVPATAPRSKHAPKPAAPPSR